jgi:hypothetical protein
LPHPTILIMKRIALLAGLLLAAWAVQAQDSLMLQYAAGIQPDPLRAHLEVLASDEYEGRETGEKGQKMAAAYIKKHFQEIGLAGPVAGGEDAYFQTFTLTKSYWAHCTLTQGAQTLKLFEDFFPYGQFTAEQEQVELVFGGYGLDTEGYSDYAGLDVDGKAVLILSGEPKKADGSYWLSGSETPSPASNTFAKIRKAADKGARYVVIAYESDEEFAQRNTMFKAYYQKPALGFDKKEEGEDGPSLLFTSPKGLLALLGVSQKKWAKLMDKTVKKGVSPAGKLRSKITVDAAARKEPVQTENVLGFLEGTDLKDEVLVITAHYDHVGIINGEIHNGADDDGSGTVAVLEIARAFAKAKAEGHGPRRSILFMTVTGEEKGLLGSAYYASHPIFPLANTVVNLNTDMVGRIDDAHKGNPDYVYVIGSDMLSTDLHQLHEDVAKRHFPSVQLDYTYNSEDDPNRYYYRSDHYNFAKNNIPVIFYFNGTHADYHKPTDTVEKIHFGKISRIAQLNFCTAWTIAHRDARPVVDKAK